MDIKIFMYTINYRMNQSITCEKKDQTRPNSQLPILDNTVVKFSFIPQIYQHDDIYPIRSSSKNRSIFLEFFESNEWLDILDYLFGELRPYLLPYYTPEMYYLSHMSTHLVAQKGLLVIVIVGIIKKYSYDQVKTKYIGSEAVNKTWSDRVGENMSVCQFYSLVEDGFYKLTQEGELFIEGIGQLSLGPGTPMKLELIDL